MASRRRCHPKCPTSHFLEASQLLSTHRSPSFEEEMSSVLSNCTNSKNHRRSGIAGDAILSEIAKETSSKKQNPQSTKGDRKGDGQKSVRGGRLQIQLLIPKSALRTATVVRGTAVARSPRHTVSFALLQNKYHEDPFGSTRGDFKHDMFYTIMDFQVSMDERRETIRDFSKASKSMLLPLLQRKGPNLALDSAVSTHLLRELMYHQVGKSPHSHCVGIEWGCVRSAPQQYKCPEQARAFALALGTAMAVAVKVEDFMLRMDDESG